MSEAPSTMPRPGQRVTTLAVSGAVRGEVMASGTVAVLVELKDHWAAKDADGVLLARSDYPFVIEEEA